MAISRDDRARQFLPFDSLKGFYEALRQKEIEYDERKELFEEEQEKIQNELSNVCLGNIIQIEYYSNGKYVNTVKEIKYINKIKKLVIFENNEKVNFNDIVDLKILIWVKCINIDFFLKL